MKDLRNCVFHFRLWLVSVGTCGGGWQASLALDVKALYANHTAQYTYVHSAFLRQSIVATSYDGK